MDKIVTRWQTQRIRDVLKARRVVAVSGPRQSGKTTLARHVAAKQDLFFTMDNESVLAAAN